MSWAAGFLCGCAFMTLVALTAPREECGKTFTCERKGSTWLTDSKYTCTQAEYEAQGSAR